MLFSDSLISNMHALERVENRSDSPCVNIKFEDTKGFIQEDRQCNDQIKRTKRKQ